jgi:hypothetical protein
MSESVLPDNTHEALATVIAAHIDHVTRRCAMPTSSDERDEMEALGLLIDPNALELHAYPWPMDAAQRVWDAGYRRHPAGITEDMVLRALYAYTGCGEEEASHFNPEVWAGMLNDMRAALEAAETVRHANKHDTPGIHTETP